jgi:GGDEF domain-containing protein
MDLEGLADVPEVHGRLARNRLLAEVREFLKSVCRLIDLAFHYPYGEFVLLLPQTSKSSCLAARRLHSHSKRPSG